MSTFGCRTRKIRSSTNISALNNDCLVEIFGYLSIKDRVRIERVCKQWKTCSEQSWSNVKSLLVDDDLWGFDISSKSTFIQKYIFQLVLKKCGNTLIGVNLNYLKLESNVLCLIGEIFSNLNHLLMGEVELTCQAVNAIASNCHKITVMQTGPCTKECNDDYLSKLFTSNPNLSHLNLEHNSNIIGTCLLGLPKDNIQHISIRNCSGISLHHIFYAIKDFKKLDELVLTNIRNKAVDVLDSDDLPLYYRTEITLPKCLKKLAIDDYFYKTVIADNYCNMKIFSNLDLLDISDTKVPNQFLFYLSTKCQNLSELYISCCEGITDYGMSALIEMKNLQVLCIEDLRMVCDVSNFTKLKKLYCIDCANVEEDGFCHLIKYSDTLEVLIVNGSDHVTARVVKTAVAACRKRPSDKLLTIDLSDTYLEAERSEMAKVRRIKIMPSNLKLIFTPKKRRT